MTLVEVVILLGAQCLSPLESGVGVTQASKVPCAVLISHDQQTSNVEIVPPSAATDPALITVLVEREASVPVSKVDRLAARPARGDITGSIKPAPHVVPTSGGVEGDDAVMPKAKPAKKKRAAVTTTRKRSGAAARDLCGSYRAVWYTNKEGRRKYRCVKGG